jgi:hypothetical protein
LALVAKFLIYDTDPLSCSPEGQAVDANTFSEHAHYLVVGVSGVWSNDEVLESP